MLTETRMALEKAADLLMDHGVIRTGPELEAMCEQIRNLTLSPQPAQSQKIKVTISQFAVLVSNTPRDMVIGMLRARGIPAIPNPNHPPTDFNFSIRVERGWLDYRIDGNHLDHVFTWDSEGAPF